MSTFIRLDKQIVNADCISHANWIDANPIRKYMPEAHVEIHLTSVYGSEVSSSDSQMVTVHGPMAFAVWAWLSRRANPITPADQAAESGPVLFEQAS